MWRHRGGKENRAERQRHVQPAGVVCVEIRSEVLAEGSRHEPRLRALVAVGKVPVYVPRSRARPLAESTKHGR